MLNIFLGFYTSVPNIFVGYMSNNDDYIESSFDIIQKLLFGHEHNHDFFKNYSFKNPPLYDNILVYEPAVQNYL